MNKIYVDGSGKAAGIYYQEQAFYFPTEGNTVNLNECLALVLGLKFAIYNNLSATIYSDSMVALQVMQNRFSPKVHLNKQAFIFNKLLDRATTLGLKITLQWIEGKSNLADAPSRAKGIFEDGWEQPFASLTFNSSICTAATPL